MAIISDKCGIFCNRTLNMRSIEAVGYDMDYTLIHYDVVVWERHAYAYLKEGLKDLGWPVDHLEFKPELAMQGLIIDMEEGNVLKANRFGYVKRAFHGTKPIEYTRQRSIYRGTLIDLRDSRWKFMNTQFSISEICMYMQLTELLDQGKLPPSVGYENLYRIVRKTLDEAHLEGLLKQEIINDPDRFVALDPEMPLTLLDQKESGKKILLITNSEWSYAAPMMTYAFDPFLPGSMTWRDLFDISIVGARKPSFFSSRSPAFEVVDDSGLLKAHRGPLQTGGLYVGANAKLVEESLDLPGQRILYVGDHIYSDVKVSKSLHRWRTALIMRELEDEIEALRSFSDKQSTLHTLMVEKTQMEGQYSAMRLLRQRQLKNYGPKGELDAEEYDRRMVALRQEMIAMDEKITPFVAEASALHNPTWGLLMRAGNEKSHFASQVERSADIYTSRVSNFLHYTPYVYLRSFRGSLPHNPISQTNYIGTPNGE
ncbi:MAG: HAD-IG family 5'-nucleotidase [Rhodothermaceae bacterium]|nr:HAD-IG family 5'-nucleotidase [Rhodothermaceae bacterium]